MIVLNLFNFFLLFIGYGFLLKWLYLKKVKDLQNNRFLIISKYKLNKIDRSFETDVIILSVMGIILIFVDVGILLSEGIAIFINGNSFYFSLLVFIISCLVYFYILFCSKDYLALKKKYLENDKLDQIKNLIDSLENRKKVLTNYDSNDRYRAEDVINSELDDLDKSIGLLKKMYSYLELNSSIAKVNEGFNLFKKTPIEKDELANFEKEIDILNAKRDLDKNVDSTIENLKKKYK